jgi:hypothetical protein
MTQLSLGTINRIPFKLKVSDKSAVADFAGKTDLPIAHLLLVAENEDLTWNDLVGLRISRGQLVEIVDDQVESFAKYFLPGIDADDVAYRIEMNSALAASRPTVHCHIIIGHKDLFGKNGLVRRSVDSALRQ